jgi:phosphohistidine phosphatase
VIVFLVRHAHAADEAPGLPDAARHLTAEGRKAARQLGDRLRWYDCAPTAVWTSPAVRAVQTCELVIAGLEWQGPVEAVPELAPGSDGDPRGVEHRLRTCAPDAVIVAVGHEPGISGLGALLTADRDFPALKKAQIARLDDVAAQRGEARRPMSLRWVFAYGDDAPIKAPG